MEERAFAENVCLKKHLMKDIGIICRLLKKKNQEKIADILEYGKCEINESGSFGSYSYSIISSFRIYLTEEPYFEAMTFSDEVTEKILEAVLVVFPHKAEAPEIVKIEFCLDDGYEHEYFNNENTEPLKNNHHQFINESRIVELKAISSSQFDLTKLIRLCEELKNAFGKEMYFSTVMLIRAIIDHVPPIFEKQSFVEVANNYGASSFKKSMKCLQESLRNIGDATLHLQIRKKEALPTKTQVDCSIDMDVLLQEIVRLLK
ncbi:hypothetical protein COB57_05400 [Candidatus Peregrinibacteria bacterium]|nr:MAG: hypothetical protein COB57_05400 [Candidatus Peregrinibacteria bacterium]